ncbi:MAG TPA: amidohydrolase family protein, partial [bacterium]|nr:amidohydrolase family protein [bacterium]
MKPPTLRADTAIEKATVYTGASAKPLKEATVLITGETLAYVGPHAKRPDYQAKETIDGRGMTLLPGLIDLHVHALINEATLASFLANGVTAIRDLASDPFHALEWKAREQTGLIASPRIFTSGPVLTCPHGYPENVWGPQLALKLTGRYQAEEKVRQLAGLGMDLIKLGLEHELGPCLSQTEVEAAVDAAHSLGKRVTAHITDARDFESCV